MSDTNALLQKSLGIVDALLSLFPDPKSVPKGHRLIGRPGWVFIAESDPCMKQCNALTLELLDLAPQLERQLRSLQIELVAEKIRTALTVEGFETTGIKPVGRGVFIDRKRFISEMRVLRSYFTIETSTPISHSKRRGPTPDPAKERIEEMYRSSTKKANYYDIAESLDLSKWGGRQPYDRVKCVVNALQQKKRRSK